MRLGRIGFDNVAGYLADGMRALEKRPELAESTKRITAPALAEWLAGTRPDAGGKPTVLDIRSEAEHAAGHVTGSINIPLPRLDERFAELPSAGPLVVHCEGGCCRSSVGARCTIWSVASRPGRPPTRPRRKPRPEHDRCRRRPAPAPRPERGPSSLIGPAYPRAGSRSCRRFPFEP